MIRFALTAFALSAGILANTANASMVLTLDDSSTVGIDVIIVDDNDGGVGTLTVKGNSNTADASAGDGILSFSGSVGTFIVNMTTGTSKPVIGTNRIDLFSLQVSGGSAGTMTLMLTDTDFAGNPKLAGALLSAGGTTDGSVSITGFVDPTNAEFGMTNATPAVVGPAFPAGAFGGETTVNSVPLVGPYSLSVTAVITHGSARDLTSLDAEVSSIPEPATVVVWAGLSLFGVAAYRRRRRS